MFSVYKDLIDRVRTDRKPLRMNFDVQMTGYLKYVIKASPPNRDIPILDVGRFDTVWRLLETPFAEGPA